MRTFTPDELKSILDKHLRWSARGQDGGERANLSRANLSLANLSLANLSLANLSEANLSLANLSEANLSLANLSEADLSLANLSEANLSLANLSEADLSRANLSEANLSLANLSLANLSRANLSEANLSLANLSLANLSLATTGQQQTFAAAGIPVIENIDSKILAAVESGNGKLEMSNWHICETTHCRAGWAIHLAGALGKLLEALVGPSAAGALIYAASRPDKPVPHFTASNEQAMDDLRKCAAEEQKTAAV